MSGTLKPPTLEESIEILGFDAQDSWKRIISGEGRNVEWVAKWRLWVSRSFPFRALRPLTASLEPWEPMSRRSRAALVVPMSSQLNEGLGRLILPPPSPSSSFKSHRRYLGERAVQVSHAYQLASLFIPTMALAFQEEISTYFLKPVRRPFPQNTNILLYSTLFYATHCSSYFAKWCRKGGDDFKAFLHFMWRYVSQLTIEEMVSEISSSSSTRSLPLLLHR